MHTACLCVHSATTTIRSALPIELHRVRWLQKQTHGTHRDTTATRPVLCCTYDYVHWTPMYFFCTRRQGYTFKNMSCKPQNTYIATSYHSNMSFPLSPPLTLLDRSSGAPSDSSSLPAPSPPSSLPDQPAVEGSPGFVAPPLIDSTRAVEVNLVRARC